LDVVGERSVGDDEIAPEILGQGLDAIEGKKKAWYSYFTTRDFWIVLALGYELIS
jgi:solute carrier family 35 protein F1/2